MSEPLYTINDGEVSHNSFDDEVVVIHLDSGIYFSLRDSAAVIWRALQRGPASAETISAIFDPLTTEATNQVGEFLELLRARRLIVPMPDEGLRPAPQVERVGTFSNPVLEPFADLQELLVADIIHDTDEKGWPHLADVARHEDMT